MNTSRLLGTVALVICTLVLPGTAAEGEQPEGAEAEVRAAVDSLVQAFAANRLDDYFGSFTPDCSFVFHSTVGRLESVQAYRDLWAKWVADDGFWVLSCATTNTRVQLFGECAVVSHDVVTRIRIGGAEEEFRERETIVLRKIEGRWLGVHEHLSPAPSGG
jgi:uncharacterized protein (TIGR02246 family)